MVPVIGSRDMCPTPSRHHEIYQASGGVETLADFGVSKTGPVECANFNHLRLGEAGAPMAFTFGVVVASLGEHVLDISLGARSKKVDWPITNRTIAVMASILTVRDVPVDRFVSQAVDLNVWLVGSRGRKASSPVFEARGPGRAAVPIQTGIGVPRKRVIVLQFGNFCFRVVVIVNLVRHLRRPPIGTMLEPFLFAQDGSFDYKGCAA